MALLNQTARDYYNGDNFGGYQFISLDDIINNFIIAYVGDTKIIPKVRRTDVAFHAQRAIQELSFDTFKSIKSQEITLPASNTMILPQDYINYTKISWVDSAGIKHHLYPTSRTSNPNNPLQGDDGGFDIIALADTTLNSSTIVLDKQYDSILVGMIVTGLGIPNNTTVEGTSTSNNVTTVTLSNNVIPPNNSTTISDVAVTFFNNNNNLIQTPTFQITQENAGYEVGSSQITFWDGAAVDMEDSGVEIGMLVSHEFFPIGTTVLDIIDNVVIVSEESTGDNTTAFDGSIVFTSTDSQSSTWSNYKSSTSTSIMSNEDFDYDNDLYDLNIGQRYGLDPQHAHINGSFYIDNILGKIHFSSNVSGKTIILDYISDGLGTDGEMIVHKFAEEAMYKSIAYAILSTTISGQALAPSFHKQKFAAIRQAKLRLSNIKIEEITQVLRGKSKWIK